MSRSLLYKTIVASIAVACSMPALADVRAGVDAWSRGDFAAAVKEWKGPADAGDADAQFNLGQAYKLGRGVKRDLAMAEALFAKAAAQGHLNAADNLGLLLFQRGERARAMPYIQAAAGRGDPRAQYLLGLAHFNGDNVAKDWVRAYALVSLAQQAGLPQAAPALAQMDQHIPIDQRRQSIALATQIASEAQATRQRQVAALDLGIDGDRPAPTSGRSTSMSDEDAGAPPAIPRMPVIATAQKQLSESSTRPIDSSPATAGADYTQPAPRPAPVAKPVPKPSPKPTPSVAPAPRPVAAPSASGSWRVQLGAFGVKGNAEKLWAKVSGRRELAGRQRQMVPTGSLTKLYAAGFRSEDEAEAACRALKGAGFDCIATR